MHTWPQGTKEQYSVPTSRQEKLDAIDKILETQTPEGPRPTGRIKWSEEEIEILKIGKCLILVPFNASTTFQECRSMVWIRSIQVKLRCSTLENPGRQRHRLDLR